MIYELRRYALAPGSMPIMHHRMTVELMPMFRKHGFEEIVGAWEAVSGPGIPIYVWMLAWPDYQTRADAWRSFLPDWAALRARDPSLEINRNAEVTIMEPWADARFKFCSSATSLDDLWLFRLRARAGTESKPVTFAAEAAALEGAGATLFGGFDLAFGSLPQSALFVSWPDAATRRTGLRAYDDDAPLQAIRTSATGTYPGLVDSVDRYMLERASYSQIPGNPPPR
ncbi:NIPSNAP family protein [Sphingobium xenophagum]|uniref:NIPSNAP family protein n=1 Tax=Sphingobium xenophagum TaxID=121428 RepID=UPI00037555D2|nr:NIPSNAP family protein [Sphingobium xenophagum]